ncbi:MAG: hypothetical protein PVJ92_03245, partial [Candidatus Dependentiae bacterium]
MKKKKSVTPTVIPDPGPGSAFEEGTRPSTSDGDTGRFIEHVVTTLEAALAPFPLPLVDCMIEEFGHDPFLILISCLLSLRARDVVTIH